AVTIPDANIVFFTPPSIPGFGAVEGFEVNLLDRASGSLKDLDNVTSEFVGSLSQRPEISFASNSFSTNFPQLQMDIDIPKAMEAGVSVQNILSTLQGYIGGFYAADFSRFGKQFRVFVQSEPDDRKDIASLNSMFVKNDK